MLETQGNINRSDDLISRANFSPQLCTLKQISSEQELTDLRAKSLPIIRRVPTITKPSALQKHRNSILEVNNLIKTILQVIELIFELGKLASTHNAKDVPALIPALEQISVDVYWTIFTVAAIVTQIDSLILDKDTKQELAPFGQKINIILTTLGKHKLLCKEQIEEAEYLKLLALYFQTPSEISVVLKFLFYGQNTTKTDIYDGETQVSIEVMQKKDIFLFFSTLDITESDFDLLIPIYNKIKVEDQYKILWVPIVKEWNDELRIQFEFLKSKMPWYVLYNFEPIRGIKFIREYFHFTNKPTIVVLSPQAKILNLNAFYMIEVWEQKYIFFYGGKDKEWIQQFTKFANILTSDSTLKEANISIELFCLEYEPLNVKRFWRGIESLFLTMVDKKTTSVTQEVQKLFSCKNESGWALLTHGSTVLLIGHGTTMLKTLSEFDNWKKFVIKTGALSQLS
ncbi:unnamed protein product [Lupinus luteus]|uniref:Sieve element occlusion N-terminal domain-containing protein n=1 Tax=Lupinus luteus TaxID=3873 RepID=A0AAV1VS91_LUPLU